MRARAPWCVPAPMSSTCSANKSRCSAERCGRSTAALKAAECLVLPEGTTPRDGASWYVNPMTALGFVETMRQEGHTALVHTAAASNLGQMLNRICRADGIGLVNIVRSPQQAALLRGQGARHMVDSSAPDFTAALTAALTETGATLGFDAVGGGPLAGQILAAMEAAARQAASGYHHYGSDRHKQVYLYGRLNTGPTTFERAPIGFAWGLGGWLLTAGAEEAGRGDGGTAARPRGRRAEDHLRQPLHRGNLPGRGAAAGDHARLLSARHGGEVPDPATTGAGLKLPRQSRSLASGGRGGRCLSRPALRPATPL